MAEAAKQLNSSVRERPDRTCRICCRQVTEQRMLSCGHYFCAECIDTIRSTADVKACPYCRTFISTPANRYPVVSKYDEPQEEEDIKKEITCSIHCQMEGCKRSVDFYCQPCKKFICYRCSQSSGCIHFGNSHAVVDVRELRPLATDMFVEWEKMKKSKIEELNNEITQLADNLKQLVVADDSDARGGDQDMVQLTQRLHNLTIQKAEERAPLEHYRGTSHNISETDLIQLVQHMTTDHPNRRTETTDQYINNISMSKGSSSIEENIVKLECPTSDQPEQPVAGSETFIPETSNSSSTKKKVILKDDDDDELGSSAYLDYLQYDDEYELGSRGYLPDQVEVHNNRSCKYTRPGVKHQRIRLSVDMGYIEFEKIELVRHCPCSRYANGERETHYSRACQWKRTVDQVTKQVYLVRRCCCQKPPGFR